MDDGSRERFDLVVGADGTWSRVRPAVSDAVPSYSGILFVEMGIDNVDRRYPDTAALVGRGMTFALGDSIGLMMHRDANAHVGFYAAFRARENVMAGKSEDVIKAELLTMFDGWSDRLLDVIRRSDQVVAARGIYMLPVGHRWKHRAGVTLVGDAAHVMSPFGGDGANLALLDAAELAAAVLRADWRDALPAFEEAMCARAEMSAATANIAIQDVFGPNGFDHTFQMFSAHRSPAPG